MRTEVHNPITDLKHKGTVEDEVILALVMKAREGDVPAIRELLDTVYGKLRENIEATVTHKEYEVDIGGTISNSESESAELIN